MDGQMQDLYNRMGDYLERTDKQSLDQQREHLLMDASMLLKELAPFVPDGDLRSWYDRWVSQFESAQDAARSELNQLIHQVQGEK